MTTLFMVKIGATPKGRLIEQHDMFFGVADHIHELFVAINGQWLEAKDIWHIDAYRQVTRVGDYRIEWLPEEPVQSIVTEPATKDLKLFFLNLGGYLPEQFEEYHHKMLIVAPTQALAIKQAKQTEFYQHYQFNDPNMPFDASSHVDDKMAVDVDDIYDVNALLAGGQLRITPIAQGEEVATDTQYSGYLSLKKLKKYSVNMAVKS